MSRGGARVRSEMWSHPASRPKWPIALALALTASTAVAVAHAQACCAGGSVVTPGRLELHEDALVGVKASIAAAFGSFDTNGRYIPSPSGDYEDDFEQDLFGAVRVLPRGQVALLVPLVQTLRATPSNGSHFGGGIGDVNLSARYDFVGAGQSRYVPGIALLAGITFPTGRPVESATPPLAVDATGIGAFQASIGLGVEQTFGPWFASATGIVAERTPRFGERLGAQVTLLAAGAYTFPNDVAFAVALSYAFEGDVTASNGADLPSTSKRLTTVSLSVLWPIHDAWRLLGSLYINPPIYTLGNNQLAAAGMTIAVIRSWS
jgi:hypothetical protein